MTITRPEGSLVSGLDHGHMAIATQMEDVVTRNARYETALQEAEILLEQVLQLALPESLANRIRAYLEKNNL